MKTLKDLDKEGRPRVAGRDLTYQSITDTISGLVIRKSTPKAWLVGFTLSFILLVGFLYTVVYLLAKGTGIWGINIPVAWGFAIINFVWWIGIGHAGTFISAILLLLRQQWRTSINRFAEAMTLFAVAAAGMFPLLHLGRPWVFYWMLPYPNTMGLWPQFRSPLVWDIFAVLTYFTVSLMFWYVGMLPDLATMRDRARSNFGRMFYAVFSLGWRGSAKHWQRWEMLYLILAALSTPLVLSVHSIVSSDFAVAIVPGWHSTIFPPFFVAGAIFSGFAMVLTLIIPVRAFYKLHAFITDRHFDNMAKLLLVTGWILTFGYIAEFFIAWYSGDKYETSTYWDRVTGPYWYAFAGQIFCNVVSIQLLWFRGLRTNVIFLFFISIVINIGMWYERFVIVVQSLSHNYLPAQWELFHPTFWDWATYIGTFGLFFSLLFLFIRILPAISMSEMKELVHKEHHDAEGKS